MFKQAYALEKIEGTSSSISFKVAVNPNNMVKVPLEVKLSFFSGGANHDAFVALFDQEELKRKFIELNSKIDADKVVKYPTLTVYGEAYGGKIQKMSHTYGPNLKFVAFDVLIGGGDSKTDVAGQYWLDVPDAAGVAADLGLDFVSYNLVDCTIESLDKERDLPSRQAVKNGILEPKIAEGIIIRPVNEFKNRRGRVIAKHKRSEFSERTSKRDTNLSSENLKVLEDAEEIAKEWVTSQRLGHILSKFDKKFTVEDTGFVIKQMVIDVLKEAKGEIVESREVNKAIGAAASKLFKSFLNFQENNNA